MFAEERQQKILDLIKDQKRVLVKELTDQLSVSIDTVRRDLAVLEERGLIERTHGGAIPAKVRSYSQPPSIRFNEGTEPENAIAKKAAEMIKKEHVVFIGGGSIHYIMVKHLPEDFPFTVITNSLKIADSIKGNENIETIMVPGKIKTSGNITDAFASEYMGMFKIDIAFSTGGGLSANYGLSTNTTEVAVFQRAVEKASRKSICLMSGDKIGKETFVRVLPAEKVGRVITDWEASENELNKLRQKGIAVEVIKS
ncbi:DeoR/GlpR family DNA-binding transcription regulator [Pseudalkalibacillus caeni]|uniref:DeoR/GlpR transcriptional regulator n=1 Tax=Exobacillus caeni TaxID=2574798 RepID=A0A5R9F3M4_9BACL|nr:DeoR/GlpR family DNA-binding transcription regulator [Pseudalkalibacillus caeni]TLS36990.1 DeoR/GlpR transcriptional regulator [Pseudalkalibacillus caeni]